MVDLGPHARVWLAIDLDHVETVAAIPMLLGKPGAAGSAQKVLLAPCYALEASRIRASPRMLLNLDERHHVVHAVVGDYVNLKPLIAAAGADVAVDYLVAVDPQVLDRNILAPCAVFYADVWHFRPQRHCAPPVPRGDRPSCHVRQASGCRSL